MPKITCLGKLSILLLPGLILGCRAGQKADVVSSPVAPAASQVVATTTLPAATTPASVKNAIPELGLLLTKEGVEFAGVECVGAYNSQVSDMVKNEAGRVTAKTFTSTCTSSGDTYIWVYSNMQYNNLGQLTAYNLKLSSSRLGKEYDLVCTNILRDNLWEVISYNVQLGGESYRFQR